MNVTDLIQSFFGGEHGAQLGQAAGLDAQAAQGALTAGLPMQLDALADHAGTPEGQSQIAEAVENLPRFGSVQEALAGPDGAMNLQRAGELLGPALLGGRAESIAQAVATQTGAAPAGVAHLLQMAMPLLLSQIGQRAGLNPGNVGTVLGGLKGSLGGSTGAGGSLGAGTDATDLSGVSPLSSGQPSDQPASALGGALQGALEQGKAALGSTGLGGAAAGIGAAALGTVGLGAVGLGAASSAQTGAADSGNADSGNADSGDAASAPSAGVDATMPDAGGALRGAVDQGKAALGGTDLGAAAAGLGATALGAVGLGAAADSRAPGQQSAANVVPTDSPSTASAAPAASVSPAGTASEMSAALTSTGLLDFMRGQFSGASADKIGSVAGFGGSTAGRATQAALPLILNALANKGKTESGAGDVLNMARPFATLSDDNGHLNTNLLGDTAELSRIEGQGRGLLGSLFGNVDELTGRLGTALGGSGASAGRLLALLTPLALSVLGGRARAGNMNAGGLSGLLGGLGSGLSGLLPSGLGALGALLGAGGLAAGASAAMGAAPPASVPTPSVTRGTVPGPAASAPIPPAPAAATTDRRGGFPLWLIPLLAVLLLGGCWLLNRRPATTTVGTTDTTTTGAATDSAATGTTDTAVAPGTFAISEPAANATLAAGAFSLRGTGKAGDTLQVLEDGTSLGNATVAADGTWSLDVPSPAAGAHTYSVKGSDGTELGSVAATVGAADANASAANCTEDYTLSIKDGQTVSEPFRFGGKGKGQGYSVTVQRGERTIGTKNIPLDSTCGWSYQSKPGAGAVTYIVRPIGDAAAEALSTVNITVGQ